MNWRRPCALAVPIASALSLWLPWVDHKAAALVLTGLDVPEFVRFVGAPGAHLVRPTQIAFALPLLALTVTACLASWAHPRSLWFRCATLAFALWLASVAFSPLERRAEFAVAALAIAAVWCLAGLIVRARALWPWLGLAGGSAASAIALWQFGRAVPALSSLYGDVSWGSGTVLAAVALAIGVVYLVLAIWSRLVSPAISRREVGPG